MPRLFHRPPKYSLHKSTKQAVVSVSGKRIYLGPYGSKRSLQRYQEVLKEWEDVRHKQQRQAKRDDEFRTADDKSLATNLTAAQLREKHAVGSPITINELILVYHRYTHEYYRKNGEVTREAGVIDDALRILRKHYGLTSADDFGPVALETLREAMIDERDWSKKYINKQVNRIRALFKWSTAKELVEPRVSQALRELSGLKKGRTRAREIARVTVVADSVIDATLGKLPQVVADMIRVQRLTSARPGEICSLAPADIDRSGDVWIYRPVEHKTEHFERDRIVAIGPRAQQILLPYLTRQSRNQRGSCREVGEWFQ